MEIKIICDCGYASFDIITFSVNNKEMKVCPKCYNDYLSALANVKTSEATANIPYVSKSVDSAEATLVNFLNWYTFVKQVDPNKLPTEYVADYLKLTNGC
jgi:C4-type Zn-finger protein